MIDEVLSVIVFFVGFGLAGFVCIFVICYLLNPFFWQGLRNSKFFDELKRSKDKKSKDIDSLIKP